MRLSSVSALAVCEVWTAKGSVSTFLNAGKARCFHPLSVYNPALKVS
jgi:hypothetical protein